jgi:hypothetical protein
MRAEALVDGWSKPGSKYNKKMLSTTMSTHGCDQHDQKMNEKCTAHQPIIFKNNSVAAAAEYTFWVKLCRY